MSPGCRGIGWFCLLTLVVATCLPRTVAVLNVVGGLALLVFLWLLYARKGADPLIPDDRLRLALWLYGGTVILSVLYPACLSLPNLTILKESLHPFGHTLHAIAVAGLCLILLRETRDFVFLCGILAAVLFAICLWSPPHFALTAQADIEWYLSSGRSSSWWSAFFALRPSGTKGYPVRWATILYLLIYPLWMLILAPGMRRVTLSEWRVTVGYLVAILVPHWLLRKEDAAPPGTEMMYLLPAALGILAVCLRHTRLPKKIIWALYALSLLAAPGLYFIHGAMPEKSLPYFLLALGANFVGVVAWSCVRRPGVPRVAIALSACLLALLNIGFSLTRTNLGLGVILCLGILGLRKIGGRRLLLSGLILLVLSGAFLAFNPRGFKSDSMRHRLFLWDGSLKIIRDHWLFGVGYGPKRFTAVWPKYQPDPKKYHLQQIRKTELTAPYHAHNLWLELLIERGIIGTGAFLFLWLMLLRYFWGTAFKNKGAVSEEGIASSTAEDFSLRPLVQLGLFLLLLMLLEGMVEYTLMRGTEMLTWLVVAIAVAAANHENRNECFVISKD